MKRIWLVLAFLLLSSLPAFADELVVLGVFDTGAFACNTGARDTFLKNPVGRDIRIKAVETWMGMSERGVADFAAHVFKYDQLTNKLSQLHILGWDHYAEPTAPANIRKSFTPDWVTLTAPQYLRLWTMCSGYPNINGHVIVFIEYTLAPTAPLGSVAPKAVSKAPPAVPKAP